MMHALASRHGLSTVLVRSTLKPGYKPVPAVHSCQAHVCRRHQTKVVAYSGATPDVYSSQEEQPLRQQPAASGGQGPPRGRRPSSGGRGGGDAGGNSEPSSKGIWQWPEWLVVMGSSMVVTMAVMIYLCIWFSWLVNRQVASALAPLEVKLARIEATLGDRFDKPKTMFGLSNYELSDLSYNTKETRRDVQNLGVDAARIRTQFDNLSYYERETSRDMLNLRMDVARILTHLELRR